jgi:hypothetical protein
MNDRKLQTAHRDVKAQNQHDQDFELQNMHIELQDLLCNAQLACWSTL